MIFISLNLLTSSDPSCKNFIYLVYIFLGKKYWPIIQYNAISVGRWWKYITDYVCLFHRHLPREVDPLVYNMSMEDPGDISYSQVGGLGDQIRELREVSQSCPLKMSFSLLRCSILIGWWSALKIVIMTLWGAKTILFDTWYARIEKR